MIRHIFGSALVAGGILVASDAAPVREFINESIAVMPDMVLDFQGERYEIINDTTKIAFGSAAALAGMMVFGAAVRRRAEQKLGPTPDQNLAAAKDAYSCSFDDMEEYIDEAEGDELETFTAQIGAIRAATIEFGNAVQSALPAPGGKIAFSGSAINTASLKFMADVNRQLEAISEKFSADYDGDVSGYVPTIQSAATHLARRGVEYVAQAARVSVESRPQIGL